MIRESSSPPTVPVSATLARAISRFVSIRGTSVFMNSGRGGRFAKGQGPLMRPSLLAGDRGPGLT